MCWSEGSAVAYAGNERSEATLTLLTDIDLQADVGALGKVASQSPSRPAVKQQRQEAENMSVVVTVDT